jgi:hypothetical protein
MTERLKAVFLISMAAMVSVIGVLAACFIVALPFLMLAAGIMLLIKWIF